MLNWYTKAEDDDDDINNTEEDTEWRSFKLLFFTRCRVEGSDVLKNFMEIDPVKDETLAFNYIPYKFKDEENSFVLKIYVVHDVEKFEEFHPLYFENVNMAVIVFDLGKSELTNELKSIEKIIQGINSSGCCIVLLGYQQYDRYISDDMYTLIQNHKAKYYQFSCQAELHDIFCSMMEILKQS